MTHRRRDGPDPGRHRRLPRDEEAPARGLDGVGRDGHAAHGHHRPRPVGVRRRRSSCSATSAWPPAWCSTIRCCRTSRRPGELDRVSTAGLRDGVRRRRASCCSSTWRGSCRRARSGCPTRWRPSSCRSSAWRCGGSSSRLPLLRRVPEPPAALEADETRPRERRFASAFVRVWETFHELRAYRQAFLMLVAFLLYNDGIQTIIRMASIYGAEIGIDRNAQMAAFVMVQFVGVPCAFVFGALADRIGAKRALLRRPGRLRRHQRARLLHAHAPGSSSRWRSWWARCRAAPRRSADRSSPA